MCASNNKKIEVKLVFLANNFSTLVNNYFNQHVFISIFCKTSKNLINLLK